MFINTKIVNGSNYMINLTILGWKYSCDDWRAPPIKFSNNISSTSYDWVQVTKEGKIYVCR